MISFRKGFEPNKEYTISSEKIKKLVEAIMGKDLFYAGSHHENLTPVQILEIIKHLMYVDGNNSLQLIIDKDKDGYHLSLTVDKKGK